VRVTGTSLALLGSLAALTVVPSGVAQAAEVPVDAFSAPAGPSTGTTGTKVLHAGVRYHVVVSGSASQSLPGEGGFSSDALYCFKSTSTQCSTPFPASDAVHFALRAVDGPEPRSGAEGLDRFGEGGAFAPFSASHTYEQHVTPAVDSKLFVLTWPQNPGGDGVTYTGSFGIKISRVGATTPAFGTDLVFKAPRPGAGLRTSSPPIPQTAKQLTLATKLSGAAPGQVAAVVPVKVTGTDLVSMCVFYGVVGIRSAQIHVKERSGREPNLPLLVFIACVKLMGDEIDKPATRSRAAAAGCPVSFVPVLKPGRTMTAARRRAVVASVERFVGASCRRSPSGLTTTLSARQTSMRQLFGARMRTGIARSRTSGHDSSTPRVVLRWKQR
jgi:hypothetical protein